MPGPNKDVAEKDFDRRIGLSLKLLRKMKKWSLRQCSGKAGVSVTAIHQAESGRGIRFFSAIKLTNAFGVEISDLLEAANEFSEDSDG